MAWIEGVTSSNRVLQDLAKIFTQANRDAQGAALPDLNWELAYPAPFDETSVTGAALVETTGPNGEFIYSGTDTNWYKPEVDLTDVYKVTVYETDATSGLVQVVDESRYTINHVLGQVIIPSTGTQLQGAVTADYTLRTATTIDAAVAKIGTNGRIILKTKTTDVTPNLTVDPFNTDPDLAATNLTMYLEIEKPKLLINPETGLVATKYGTQQQVENHFHVNVRMFDELDYGTFEPTEDVVDTATGLVTRKGAHVSEWSKFSWYVDFKEFLVDELDADPGTDNIGDGITYAYVDTQGIYGDLPIQFWISANNDRVAMVLMGEPSINYDNYIISFGYFGKIDSFDGSKNDTAGNFAITVGSNSIPCVSNPNPDPITDIIGVTGAAVQATIGNGNYSKEHKVSYRFVAFNDHGIGMPTLAVPLSYVQRDTSSSISAANIPTDHTNFEIRFNSLPANAKGVRIYRKDEDVSPAANIDTDWYLEAELDVTTALARPYRTRSAQDMNEVLPYANTNPDDNGVVRDAITGAIMKVNTPKTWGQNTATGVNDISMYKTRSGVYYQRHQASFITPEEYMHKDAFNPSRWTNKFHLSPLYVVHGYDGYRGWLKDVVVVDDSAIVHLDELIVGKGTAQEEIYKYFKLNAPFSLMTTSANSNYGIGIKKV